MKTKILVIDDDPKIVQVLKIRLKFEEYEVLTAADGVSGLKLALESKPDLVILDIMMPVGGGFSMAYHLRKQLPEVPIIFITASKQQGLREMADKLGASGFIEKPYEKEQLLAAVDKALKSRPTPPVGGPDTSEPQAPASATATPATNPPVIPLGTSKPPVMITGRNKILIVEDDRRITMALATRLRAAGQDVVLAYDASTGVDSAVKDQPDLILMDINLPGGSGLIAAQRIQSMVPKLTPIIFLTASQQPGLREKALALGAAGFLMKPYDPQELLGTIQNALSAAADKSPGSKTPEPTTPENALNLQLANLKMVDSPGNAPKSQPKLVRIIGRNKILIVEDNRRIAKDLTLQLQNAGQEVIQASDEISGVEAATKHQPDLILMDINLSGGSGLLVAQRIQSAVSKLTPIIFLTTGQQPELRQKALAFGAAGFLEKSCDPDVLFSTIQNALDLGRGDDPTTHSNFN